ncbi:MAG: hypothetical protein IPM93_28805 [Candidatus Obscuribacter sp.]|nr:hypothetical protein [Candidatus Obscuribacter sp.]
MANSERNLNPEDSDRVVTLGGVDSGVIGADLVLKEIELGATSNQDSQSKTKSQSALTSDSIGGNKQSSAIPNPVITAQNPGDTRTGLVEPSKAVGQSGDLPTALKPDPPPGSSDRHTPAPPTDRSVQGSNPESKPISVERQQGTESKSVGYPVEQGKSNHNASVEPNRPFVAGDEVLAKRI